MAQFRDTLTPDQLAQAVLDLCMCANGPTPVLRTLAQYMRDWSNEPFRPPTPQGAIQGLGLAEATDQLAQRWETLEKSEESR